MEAICEYCGTLHAGTCWRVKAIEYHDNGCVKRVELITNWAAPSLAANAITLYPPGTLEHPILNAGRFSQEPT